MRAKASNLCGGIPQKYMIKIPAFDNEKAWFVIDSVDI